MPRSYDRAPDDTNMLCRRVMRDYHSPLHEAKVTVGILLVRKTDKGGYQSQALTSGGHPVAAKIRITSLENRVRGLADCQMLIDDYSWKQKNRREQEAILDHELRHIALDEEGPSDDAGRPKLRMRAHDWVSAGFAVIAERYGADAMEVQTLRDGVEQSGQLQLFPAGAASLRPRVRQLHDPGSPESIAAKAKVESALNGVAKENVEVEPFVGEVSEPTVLMKPTGPGEVIERVADKADKPAPAAKGAKRKRKTKAEETADNG